MRDYDKELKERAAFIKGVLKGAGAKGVVFGNSGGKDCALVGALCKAACDNVLGIIMPCQQGRNYNEDMEDALRIAKKYDIKTQVVDLTAAKEALVSEINSPLSAPSMSNINPRLRMITLYSIAQSNNYLVAGTGNRSEIYMGYFTKWGDGGYDFNPIADLTVTEVYEFLNYLNAPCEVIKKAPSAGLFEGQTDEADMGVSYKSIDDYLLYEKVSDVDFKIINKAHNITAHKRSLPKTYK